MLDNLRLLTLIKSLIQCGGRNYINPSAYPPFRNYGTFNPSRYNCIPRQPNPPVRMTCVPILRKNPPIPAPFKPAPFKPAPFKPAPFIPAPCIPPAPLESIVVNCGEIVQDIPGEYCNVQPEYARGWSIGDVNEPFENSGKVKINKRLYFISYDNFFRTKMVKAKLGCVLSGNRHAYCEIVNCLITEAGGDNVEFSFPVTSLSNYDLIRFDVIDKYGNDTRKTAAYKRSGSHWVPYC